MPIEAILERMRPVEGQPELTGRIGELIARARATKPDMGALEIAIDDLVASIEFVQITGPAWRDLVAVNPPRKGATHDFAVGYNVDSLVRSYPTRSVWRNDEEIATVLVDGEPVTDEQWAEFTTLLNGAGFEDAATVLWAIHYGKPRARLAALQVAGGSNNG
ncbi:hypothetical protein HF576_16455 [Microbacterium sp. CFH 90308]|uniref:Uncharacterized protein n=1 Tax=Microbacterium salsuginis TaxID=2722803 RepID=A0ABX1KH47_9MICO|nr:hypothetical protein [Microbacterium sp. CFH 90308]NLP85440.1 hypothetical protein [Microbacterium sp. CFH 90308]